MLGLTGRTCAKYLKSFGVDRGREMQAENERERVVGWGGGGVGRV